MQVKGTRMIRLAFEADMQPTELRRPSYSETRLLNNKSCSIKPYLGDHIFSSISLTLVTKMSGFVFL